MFAFPYSQVYVVDSPIYLRGQLLKSPFQNSSALGFQLPVTLCRIHSLNSVGKADAASGPRSKHDVEQVGAVHATGQLSLETCSLDRSRSRLSLDSNSAQLSPQHWRHCFVGPALSTPVSPACLTLSSGEKILVMCLAHTEHSVNYTVFAVHRRKCSTLLVIRDRQIQPQWSTTSHLITSVGKEAEKMEPSYNVRL